jgi:protein-S-isoprenylcysteine O-methyltransferase Ste14
MLELFLQNNIYYYMFYIMTFLWLFEFILLRPKSKGQKTSEKTSFLYILFSVLTVVSLNIVSGFFPFLRISNTDFHGPLMIFSLILYSIGLLLRYVSILYLGKYFTRDVSIESKHELISSGPYTLLRHPLYVGLFLLTTSVPLFFGHMYVYILAIILMSTVLNQRMKLEEALLTEHFKESYTTWKSRRYRFIPFIY